MNGTLVDAGAKRSVHSSGCGKPAAGASFEAIFGLALSSSGARPCGLIARPQVLALLRVWCLKVGHAKRHHMGHLLERRGDAAFGNHQTLRRAQVLLPA